MTTSGSLIVVEPPEADSHIVIFDSDAATAEAAIDAAWAAYKRGEKRAIRQKLSPTAREGWEEVQVYLYETSPNERAVAQAVARRAKSNWTVVLLNGKQPTFEKRGAAVGLIQGSLRPSMYRRESFAGRKAGALNAERLAQMKEFVEMAMKKLDVPGVGVAYIDNGKIVYEGGHGVKELGKPDAVDANTLFMAASNTKGMTTLLLAKLVDEGKVKWDDFVTAAYPRFKLGDARTTEQVRIEHLICACTGLPRQDLPWLFEFRKATAAFSMEMLGRMQPTSGLARCSSTATSWPRAPGTWPGTCTIRSSNWARPTTSNEEEDLRAAGDEADDVRLCPRAQGNHASPL
jgi:hypothetical protein